MANEFVIKNGYFSQGNSNVTGSLQVSGSIGVVGSGSDVLSVYGSQGNLLIATDTFSGSIFTVTDISGYPILDITSNYYTNSVYLPTLQLQPQQYVVAYDSQSGQLFYISTSSIGGDPFPYTGSAEITGSLIISGGFTVYNTSVGFTSIDSNNTFLVDTVGVTSVDWSGRGLYDNGTNSALNWGSRYLYADDGTTVQIEWWDPAAIILPNITTNPVDNILGIDNTGRVYYTASSAIGGGGSGTPGGSDKQIQFNANGGFSGSSNFTFDSASNTVTISGSLTVSGSSTFTNIGPAIFSGSVTSTQGFTGSLLGTSSWASNALTASFTQTAQTASYVTGSIFTNTNPVLSASYALTASHALNGGGSGTTINNNVNNYIVTATGTANTLNGEANLQFDGSTLTITGSITASSDISTNGDLKSNFSSGDEGGQIFLNKPVTNTSITGGINIDVYQNRVRIFETGGTNRGGFWDITSLEAGVNTNLLPYSTSSIIGNGLSSSFNINHGFNTRNLHITVYESASTGETVYPDIRRINENTASIIFANPPLTNQYIVYISQ